jgi:hypothetical protein
VKALQLGVVARRDSREEAVLADVVVEVGAELLGRLDVVVLLALQQGGEAGDGGGEESVQLRLQLLPLGLRAARPSCASKYAATNWCMSCSEMTGADMTRLWAT